MTKLDKLLLGYKFSNELGEPMSFTASQKRIMTVILDLGAEGDSGHWKSMVQIETPTQVGKSSGVAAALCMRTSKREKWVIVAGTAEKAQIIMDYFISYCLENVLPRELLKSQISIDKLKQDRSRRHLTFASGFEIRVFSADSRNKQATGNAVMGFGCLLEGEKLFTNKGELAIQDIVNQKLDVKILSFNHGKDKVEFCDILDFQQNPRAGRRMMEIETAHGTIKCTDDHPIFVEGKGYIKAFEIKPGDLIWRADMVSLKDDRPVRNLQERILYKTFSLSKSIKTFLQSCLSRFSSQKSRKSELERPYMLVL